MLRALPALILLTACALTACATAPSPAAGPAPGPEPGPEPDRPHRPHWPRELARTAAPWRSQDRVPSYAEDPLFGDEEYRHMRVSFDVGLREYKDRDFGGLDTQTAVGFTATQEPPDWILGLDGGMYWAGGDNDLGGFSDVELNSWEGFMGVMKTLPIVHERLLIEVGAGYALSYLYVDDDDDQLQFDGEDLWWSTGYFRASALLRLGDDTWLGVNARSARGGSGELLGADLEGDYDQLSMTLSSRW